MSSPAAVHSRSNSPVDAVTPTDAGERGKSRPAHSPLPRVETEAPPMSTPPPTIKRSDSPPPTLGKRPRAPSVSDPDNRLPVVGERKYRGDKPLQPSEYESNRVICETCSTSVSFRDEHSGEFTLKHWEAHRITCSEPNRTPPPPTKRRRAKRTEDERIDYLRNDPYVAQFEAYRVLCASCDKWIRLRPNSTYCSIPWDAHRKSCLSKKITSKNTYALEQRNAAFSKDPDVRKFDAERVLCAICDCWVPVPVPDDGELWAHHRTACRARSLSDHHHSSSNQNANPSASASSSSSSQPQPQPPPPHQPTNSPPVQPSSQPPPPSTPAHESRRRNAEQRAATLRADALIVSVEPNRVFCSLCQKWVQLRQDSSFCAYPWLQHRGKCLMRSQKRAQKERDQRHPASAPYPVHAHPPRPRTGVESEEDEDAEGSWDEDVVGPRVSGSISFTQAQPPPPRTSSSSSSSYVDLDSTDGRLSHIHISLIHLFRTTYSLPDTDLTVAALVGFLNAGMPEDRWEEFDLREVVRGVGILAREGRGERRVELEGDIVRWR
ncbi:uncharacterized protein BT62DRAFT_933487 [Guyanagaster necrorhizus]|uniref:Uncharacterized protein n=1 Tax=Guyanagaster necrorhizus TaxID=856835 RepID=A0A9P8ARN0_9AGAR|nr:uncharacterized protein BT62DRAFT_933487 [Guyanagaster necrorhizus MCA 3950]KAG7445071.1 hypothetical protein BT62DRAFT_933487 [Guyanagaster necrorhizus MCA 3950]